MSVKNILEHRNSVRHYDPDYKISPELLASFIESASKSPNGNNVQAVRYLIIDDPQIQKSLLPIAYNQQQVVDASAVLVMLGDYKALRTTTLFRFTRKGFKLVISMNL